MNTPDWLSELKLEERNPPSPKGPVDLLHGYEHEDVGNAQRIIALQGERLRYCHAFKKWLIWDDRRWRVDETDVALLLAQRTMMEFASQAIATGNGELRKFAIKSLQWSSIRDALRLAESRVPVLPTQLDTDPDLLNFLNGTLNLKTGELRPHARADCITKLVHHDYDKGAKCPRFCEFLEKIVGGNSEAELPKSCRRLIYYLQKAFGYSLTGHTIEKAVFLLWGPTDTGKSTLLSTFLELLEEYAVLIQIDTLMVRPQESNNAQADLADLRGARFVMTSETEEGQRLAEGKLKRITQGTGRIKAIRKYENPIEFYETHKLWIDANHLPRVRGTDNAIWNRLHPVPFSATIPKDEQDRGLHRKLVAEGAGILAWAVAGARRWYKVGLRTPPEVQKVGKSWRDESDQIKRFIDEECDRGQYFQARGKSLYGAYKGWAEGAREHVMNIRDFSNALVERGFESDHDRRGTYYKGLMLRPKEEPEGVTGDRW